MVLNFEPTHPLFIMSVWQHGLSFLGWDINSKQRSDYDLDWEKQSASRSWQSYRHPACFTSFLKAVGRKMGCSHTLGENGYNDSDLDFSIIKNIYVLFYVVFICLYLLNANKTFLKFFYQFKNLANFVTMGSLLIKEKDMSFLDESGEPASKKRHVFFLISNRPIKWEL